MLSHPKVREVTPGLHIRNEEYWIHYVLRDILKVFGRAIVIDTGSTDKTVDIVKKTFDMYGLENECLLVEENMGTDAIRIGQCSTRLRSMISTPWMLLVDGDEIWREEQLVAMLDGLTDITPDKYQVGMLNGRNVIEHESRFVERDGFSADRLFNSEVRWDKRSDYPFQSHALEDRSKAGKVAYFDGAKVFFWHMRHIVRSHMEEVAYFRQEKRDYFPWNGKFQEMPDKWLMIDQAFANPYVHEDATLGG